MTVCAACGVESPAGFRFCGGCGAALGDAAPGRRERRVVSVLFADLVGFTSRSEQLDVEDVDGFLGGYHRLLRRELERCGGTVEKFIGDAVMALFGAPVAHEDDAERAVRAALSIQDAVAELRDRDGVDLHVRVGVTTGEALVALGANPQAGEGMATGDVVNTAARLQSAAPVDGVLVDERTHRSTDRAIRFEAAEAVAAKGKSEPVEVWRAIEPRSLMPEQSRADDVPLVGRGDEVALLVGALNRSQREPSTQLVTVTGAPGIGKTRLVDELLAHVEGTPALIRWRRGRSLAYGSGVAVWALGEMVKAQAGILESDSASLAHEKLDAAVADVVVVDRDRAWVVRHLRPLVGLEAGSATGGDSQAEAFAAWRRFFEALAEDGPTVLVFEDLHWADDTLLDFIDLLAERAGAVPLLIVCTARPDLFERRPAWGGGKINASTINLPPLSIDDTARLVAELLGQALLPAETQTALLERAEGNPLYAQEYVRMLRDRGLLVRDSGGWTLVGEPEGLPETVQAIIAARLDTLSDTERTFLQDAAVVGRTAWLGALGALSETSSWEAEELLHVLERKQLIRRARRSSVEGEIEFVFTHALTQEVAYAQIRRSDRAEKHERAAAWIGQLAAERDDRAELLAHHYGTALVLRRQTGDDFTELIPKARDAHAEAGRQAQALNAHAMTARHLSAAIDLTDESDPKRPRLLLDHARASFDAGDVDETTVRSALDAQVTAKDWQGAAIVGRMLSHVLMDSGLGTHADETLAQAAEHAERIPYTEVASEIAYTQASRMVIGGRAAEAVAFTEYAMRRAREAGHVEGHAMLLGWHGDARIACGDSGGIEEMREAAAILADRGHRFTSAAYQNMAENLVGLGDLAGANTAREAAARWAERFGMAYHVLYSTASRANAAYHDGDWQLALDLTAGLVESALAVGFVLTLAQWTHGRIMLAQGDGTGPLRDAAANIAHGASTSNDEALFEGLALAAAVYQAAGDAPQAASACDRFLLRWNETGGMPNEAPMLAEVALIPGHESVIVAAAKLLPETSRWRSALVATAEGRHAEAADLFAKIGSRPLEASACLLAAESAAADGHTAEAAHHAERALAFYRRVGASLYINQAERYLRRPA